MANALTNPYEFTCGGITVKCTPYTGGSFITNRDLPKDEFIQKKFKVALFGEYHVVQEPELDGIKVLGKKENEDGEQIGDKDQSETQGIVDKGSRKKGIDGIKSS